MLQGPCYLSSNQDSRALEFIKQQSSPTSPCDYALLALVALVSVVVWPLLALSAAMIILYLGCKCLYQIQKKAQLITLLNAKDVNEQYEAKLEEWGNQKDSEYLQRCRRILMNAAAIDKSEEAQAFLLDPKKHGSNFIKTFLATEYSQFLSGAELEKMKRDQAFIQIYNKRRNTYKSLDHSDKMLELENNAKLTFVKTVFKIGKCKEALRVFAWLLLPCGIFGWSSLLPSDDRAAFENNREFFEGVNGFESYTDLIDAHNQLISSENFLNLPYNPNARF